MPNTPRNWRDHYLELMRQGETAGYAGARLGEYIAQRMAPQELRDCIRTYYIEQDARQRAGGSDHAEQPNP